MRISTLSFACLLSVSTSLHFAAIAESADSVDLTPQVEAGDLRQVLVELEVGGDMKVRDQSRAKSATEEGPIKTVPMSVIGKVEYDERLLDGNGGTLPNRSARHYRSAEATLKVADGGVTRELSDHLRLVLVHAGEGRPLVVSPSGPIQREELDLVDLIGNTTVLHTLLPGKEIADGDTWPMDSATVQKLLGLDSVALCEVESVLDEVNAGFARIRFKGVVDGTVDGAATELALQAVYLFDRKSKQITQFNLAIKEVRTISPASPGLDVVAKLRIKLKPISESDQLSDEVIAQLPTKLTDKLLQLELRDEQLGFAVTHDRLWYVTGDLREKKTLRRIDADGLVAQCTITKLPPQSAERPTMLEQFSKDIQFALGKNFGEIVASEQWTNQHGERCLGAVVLGQVDTVPVQWRYYLLAPEENGPRLSIVVTVAQDAIDRLGKTDREMVDRINLLPDAATPAAETAQRPLHESVLKTK